MSVYAIIGGTGLTQLEGLTLSESCRSKRRMARRPRRSSVAATPGARCCSWRVTVIRTASRRTR